MDYWGRYNAITDEGQLVGSFPLYVAYSLQDYQCDKERLLMDHSSVIMFNHQQFQLRIPYESNKGLYRTLRDHPGLFRGMDEMAMKSPRLLGELSEMFSWSQTKSLEEVILPLDLISQDKGMEGLYQHLMHSERDMVLGPLSHVNGAFFSPEFAYDRPNLFVYGFHRPPRDGKKTPLPLPRNLQVA